MQNEQASYIAKPLLSWYSQNARDLPWRKTKDPYAIWISEVMLQQTQVVKVIDYWNRWMNLFPSIADLANADTEKVLKAWEGLGYYTRCKNLMRAAQVIMEDFRGEFPSKPESISSLPGIGPYTTGAIGSIAFNHSLPLVDGNVERIITRFLAIEEDIRLSKTKAKIWDHCDDLIKFITNSELVNREDIFGNMNQALMELGATICLPKKPDCKRCPISLNCIAFEKKLQNKLPVKSKTQKIKNIFSTSWVLIWNDKIIIEKASDKEWNSGLYRFPTVEERERHGPLEQLFEKQWNFIPSNELVIVGNLRHAITHHRIRIRVVKIALTSKETKNLANDRNEWATLNKIKDLPFSGANLKILNTIDYTL